MSLSPAVPLPRGRPEAVGVDPRGVAGFLDSVAAAGIELHSLMLYRAGHVIAEGWWAPYRPELPHMQHSLTKSFTATAVGLAAGEGLLGLDDKVVSFFPDEAPQADPNLAAPNLAVMTVRDLLTMRSGHSVGISGADWRPLRTSWVAAFLHTPVPNLPGRRFVYSSASSYMLSAIVQRVTGQRLTDYLKPRLFDPVGMTGIEWEISPEGVTPGGNGLSCPTEESLRLGILHLRDGMWNGRRVLPAGWVAAVRAVDRHPPSADAPVHGYGLHWWGGPGGAYYAAGLFGQYSIVLPAQDAVLALTGVSAHQDERLLDLVWRDLYPALGGSRVTRDSAMSDTLSRRLAQLRIPTAAPGAIPKTAALVSGLTFAMAPNDDGVASVRLSFDGDRCVFKLRDDRGEHRIDVGLNGPVEGVTTMTGAALHHQYEPGQMRVVASGCWTGERDFEMTWRFNEIAFCDRVACRFDADRITFRRSVNVNAGPIVRPPLFGTAV
jgi:CubicO group peptidase (beta-lactamase class C family)